jgi:hypothetical protein
MIHVYPPYLRENSSALPEVCPMKGIALIPDVHSSG